MGCPLPLMDTYDTPPPPPHTSGSMDVRSIISVLKYIKLMQPALSSRSAQPTILKHLPRHSPVGAPAKVIKLDPELAGGLKLIPISVIPNSLSPWPSSLSGRVHLLPFRIYRLFRPTLIYVSLRKYT